MNVYIWEEIPPLNFTANTAGSTVKLNKVNSPTSVTLETSTDWNTWTSYTIWDTITLSNIWDKVYFRNTSESDTWFGIDVANYYKFVMTWSIAWSWDVNYLLNKNCTSLTTAPSLPATILATECYTYIFSWCTWLTTAPSLPATTLANYCYAYMFNWCTWLTTAPSLPATTLASYCYSWMFYNCSNLTTLPSLPATTLADWCYYSMFQNCSKIKLSTTQTWEYQTAYRIPTTWTWTTGTSSLGQMFYGTWWTFNMPWTPSINTTYYTSNTVV